MIRNLADVIFGGITRMTTTIPFRMWIIGPAVVTLSLTALSPSTARSALLEGKTLSVDLEHRTNLGDDSLIVSAPVTVGPGVELMDFGMRTNPDLPALVDIDLADTTILLTLVIDQPLASLERIRFVDLIGDIPPFTNVTIDPSTNWAGFESGRIVFSQQVIGVNLGQLSGLAGQQILLNVTPEPTAAAFALAPLAALTLRRRAAIRR